MRVRRLLLLSAVASAILVYRKKRLDEKGIRYSDYGGWAMAGWHQIFFYDPDGNVIEVHQAPQ